MEITKFIEVLTDARRDWYKSVIRTNQDWSEWWDFEVDYSENEQWESWDVILTIKQPTDTKQLEPTE